ncbi:MAG TPA: radical SAM family heme chaperone HemW [Bacilli bacterium]|nr:radical SAM family heme chaperone HemW [Bacilli bacterium]
MKSVYIHIPFCNNICSYCDFCKVLYNRSWARLYLDKLKEEVNNYYEGEKLETIYIGGGTPSALSKEDLYYLFKIVKIFKLERDCEFTFECNINDINRDLLNILKVNKVNRLSIGIESFDKDKLKQMRRPSRSYEETKEIIKMCRNMGFKNINMDLIYGFKEEKFSTLQSDLKKILSLKPEHISTYSLMIDDNTFLGILNKGRLDDENDAKMYDYICKKLNKKGYKHYEVSNFALPGYESKHNLKYWNNEEYYGFGLGASGYTLGFRYDNTKSLTKYLEGTTRINSMIISKREKMENEIMLGLRKIEGINLKKFFKKYNVNIQDEFPIEELLKAKELVYKKGNLYIPKDKLYIMNEILIKLL